MDARLKLCFNSHVWITGTAVVPKEIPTPSSYGYCKQCDKKYVLVNIDAWAWEWEYFE